MTKGNNAYAERDRFIALVQMYAEKHQEDQKRGGCTCGFCVWSAEHVLIMAVRDAWDDSRASARFSEPQL